MNDLLAIALSAAVPLHIAELQRRGGPTLADVERARAFAVELASHGDDLQFGNKKKGAVAALFNGTAFSIAVCSFSPGGVTIFGEHWESFGKHLPPDRE